jgi:alkylation response protein AidB-like acyl-CoA dehydrogenase
MYRAPLEDLQFVLGHVLDAPQLARLPHYAEFSAELAQAVLEEAGRFATGVLEPINRDGDRQGATWTPDGVRAAPGFAAAYAAYTAGGWAQLGVDAAHGGQGAPQVLGTAVEEIWCGASMAFMLCPLLSRGAVEAMLEMGSPELQQRFLPKMVSGEWTGTMNLTEPQAGSDLALIRTRAAPAGDHYLVSGQKIFITWGDHDLTDNIVHLVLARIDGAPPGIKGISLFLVPKFLVDAEGRSGKRNDVRCVSIENKLGIHASPTCVLAYGDAGGAVGYLVGEPHRGLEAMFIMMNAARLSVGVQGIGLAERARQQATDWARSRVQGKPVGVKVDRSQPIIQHTDVQRMLLTMRSGVSAMRALAMYTALQLDLARAADGAAARATALARGELLIPIVKAWCTEYGNELVQLAVQVHGGMGFIEETGIAQVLRDARITTIYEGTTGIQANDLLGRKLARDAGAAMRALVEEAETELAAMRPAGTPEVQASVAAIVAATREALADLTRATQAILPQAATAPAAAFGVAVPYLRLCGVCFGGWLMARAANAAAAQLAAGAADADFMRAKLQDARFYASHTLPLVQSLARTVRTGGDCLAATDVALL